MHSVSMPGRDDHAGGLRGPWFWKVLGALIRPWLQFRTEPPAAGSVLS